jgi:hypothetical protein
VNVRRVLISIIAASSAALPAQAAEPRARFSIDDAMRVAGELFPDLCGSRGRRCSITIDARADCPSEILIRFPDRLTSFANPRAVWVALDDRGRPIAIASRKQETCAKA